MKISIVANYLPDRQESMLRFEELLHRELVQLGVEVQILRPPTLANFLGLPPSRLGKWIGYLDKLVLFPLWLKLARPRADVMHISDHSNAFYSGLFADPVLVTCHDLLAVRGALGEIKSMAVAFMGRRLQNWVRRGLQRADLIVCTSTYTYDDTRRLIQDPATQKPPLRLVPIALNYPYQIRRPEEVSAVLGRLEAKNELAEPFLLQVGSNHSRKNRDGTIRIFAEARKRWKGRLVFAGMALTPELRQLARDLGVADFITEIVKPDNVVLEALYNRAFALLFPSRFEGFGWPPVEAQACGCPVIASDAGPFAEVLGDSAPQVPVDDIAAFADRVVALENGAQRRDWIERGLKNVARYAPEKMARDYVTIYREMSGRQA